MRFQDENDRDVRLAWYTVGIRVKAEADGRLPSLAWLLGREDSATPKQDQSDMRQIMREIVATHNAQVAKKASA